MRALISQILRFGVVGVVGFVVNAGVDQALVRTLGPWVSQALAFPLAATTTWWLNRRFTFVPSARTWMAEWGRYISTSLLGWLVNNGVYVVLILQWPVARDYPVWAVAAGSLGGMVFNFVAARLWVFV